MGKLEKFGRNLLKKLGTAASPRRRRAATTSSTSSSSDDERERGTSSSTSASAKTKSMPDVSYIHNFMVIPPDGDDLGRTTKPESPNSDEMSAGYATDDTVLSSLSPLEIKRSSLEYYEGSESQGYYSTAELSPREEILEPAPLLPQSNRIPRIVVSPEPEKKAIYQKKEFPRVNVSSHQQHHQQQHQHPIHIEQQRQSAKLGSFREKSKLSKSQNELSSHIVESSSPSPRIHQQYTKKHQQKTPLMVASPPERSATLSNLVDVVNNEDPIDRFLKSSIYKTKMITTVFEAKNGGFEEIYEDICHEIDRWFETKNMMAVACEMHWSAPREKRNRQLECRLKEKLLNALRENNRRLLYLRGMGRGKTPVKLAESKTMENITRDKETDSVRGIYQRSYTRLLPYLHKETPEWHSQYWTLQDFKENDQEEENHNYFEDKKSLQNGKTENLQPDPQHFLFDDQDSAILAKNSLLLITATNSEDSSKTASTILHIDVENLDDNSPEFLESLSPLFQIEKNTTKPTAIGRLTAYDLDGADVFYHILPACGSEYSSNFSIDPEFGEIVYHPSPSQLNNLERIEICVMASSQKSPDLSDVFFDSGAKNMRKVVVKVGGSGKDGNPGMFISGNDTVVSMGDSLQNIEIPMQLNMIGKSESSMPDYKLESLNFVPANYELGRDIISPEGSVDINPKTGEIVANGKIVDTPQGVFIANIERDGNQAVKQLHHIKNDRKLRYRLAMSRNEFGANVDKLKRQIHEALEVESSGKRVRVYFDEPKMDEKNSSWTSVCFYITRDNAILDEKQMHSMISNNNGHISKLHHIFKVQDVNECAIPEKESKSEWYLPQNTIILIGVVALLILLLIALLVYVCCVARYRRHLETKAGKMRAYSSSNYYKSPNFMPPPPGYISASPPIPPPAIGYY